ncbi:MAG: RNA polymerase sigma factor [Acidimicrobiales bacterium]
MSDNALLERVLNGDETAFVEIVRRYNSTLVRVARTYVANDATAEDVAQETWMAVVRGIERFEGRSTFKTWLFRICVNRARSAGVREHRSVPVDLTPAGPTVDTSRFNGAGMWADPPVPFTELVEGRIDDKPTVAAIRRTIDGLPEATRAVVTLRDVEGLSTVEVADLLGITEANVRVIVHRGRAKVRAALEDMMRGGRQ